MRRPPPTAGRRSAGGLPSSGTIYVLDEFTYPLKWGWIDVDEVLATLAARPGTQHVVITGRDAPQQLLDAADLVTEMTKVNTLWTRAARAEGHRVVTLDKRERPQNHSIYGASAYKHGRPLLACGPTRRLG